MFELDHHLHVAGTGRCVPDNVVTNDALQDLVRNYEEESGSFSQWIDRVTHIQTRRFLDQDASPGDLAREAARIAIETSGVDPAEIDLFVMATFTTKNIYPGEETKLVDELGLGEAASFYLTAACAGGVFGLQVAHAFLRSGIYRHVLVVGAEHLSAVTDFGDPMTAIIFGDGAGAAVLSRRDEPGAGGIAKSCVMTTKYVPGNIMMDNNNVPPRERELVVDGEDGPIRYAARDFLKMKGGPRVLRYAVNSMAKATVKSLGFTMKDLKEGNEELRVLLDRAKIIPHQANGRIIDGLRDKLGVRDDQVYKTIYRYGNISAASNMVTLDYAMREGSMRRVEENGLTVEIQDDEAVRIQPGDLVLTPTVGAGYLIGCFAFVHD